VSRVVIRCPNCGTTQADLGECDACHHDGVSYYCTNHPSGRFLDGPTCPECGAAHGIDAPPPAPRRDAPLPPSAPVEWGPPPGGPRSRDRELPPEWVVVEPDSWPGAGDPRRRPADSPFGAPFDLPLDAGRDPRFERIDPTDAARVVARGAMGCVGRLVMMVVVLIVLAVLLVGGFIGGMFG